MAMTKTEIARELSDDGYGDAKDISAFLDALAEIAERELEKGEDFSVPGIVKLRWKYNVPYKKGERYKKGETYTGIGGVEVTAEADSKPRPASVRLQAQLAAPIKRIAPTKSNMASFVRSKTAKSIISRLS